MFSTYAKASAGARAGGGVPAGAASASGSSSSWHPTVLYLAGLLAVEFLATAALSHYLLKE